MANRRRPKYYVNVNSKRIRSNSRRLTAGADCEPPIAVRRGRGGSPSYPAGDLLILDGEGAEVGRLRYEPLGGLSCGARVFLELLHEPRSEAQP